MMVTEFHSTSEQYLDSVEQHSHRTLHRRADIAFLLKAATTTPLQQLFEEITFQAKFVTNALHILQRIGTGTEDTIKLTSELNVGLEKVASMLRTLVKESPADVRQQFLQTYLAISPESLANLTSLLEELRLIKNFELDRERAG